MSEPVDPLAAVERHLLGGPRHLTRHQVAERAGVPFEVAEDLWGQLGFPRTDDDDVAFTDHDVEALRMAASLVEMGVLDPGSHASLVRTWGRSYARLAEWQIGLLAGLALEDADPDARLDQMLTEVVPRIGRLQDYVWRRHLESAAQRVLPGATHREDDRLTAVVFVDIVGYTSRSRQLTEPQLLDLVEVFEGETTRTVVEVGGHVIKTIGDEVMFVVDDPFAAVEAALDLAERGEDDGDPFPQVRVGLAYGAVTPRLGDVFGPTVNVAARLTSVARAGTVLVDRGAFDVLTGQDEPETPGTDGTPLARLVERAADELAELSPFAEHGELRFRRLRRVSVKGYRHLEPWLVRRRLPRSQEEE